MEGIHEEGQVCCYDFKVNLFSFLLICSVAVPLRSSAVREGGVVSIVQGRLLGLEVRDEEGQVCCYDFKVNLFSILLIWSVAAPLRSSAVKEDGVVGIVQGRVLGLEVRDGLGKLSYFDSI